jgi:hypothetical protein
MFRLGWVAILAPLPAQNQRPCPQIPNQLYHKQMGSSNPIGIVKRVRLVAYVVSCGLVTYCPNGPWEWERAGKGEGAALEGRCLPTAGFKGRAT